MARPDVSEASDEIPEEAEVTVVAGEQDSTELSLLSSGAVGTCSGLLDACFSGAWSWTTIGMAALAMTLDAKMAVANEFWVTNSILLCFLFLKKSLICLEGK